MRYSHPRAIFIEEGRRTFVHQHLIQGYPRIIRIQKRPKVPGLQVKVLIICHYLTCCLTLTCPPTSFILPRKVQVLVFTPNQRLLRIPGSGSALEAVNGASLEAASGETSGWATCGGGGGLHRHGTPKSSSEKQ